MSEGRQYVDQLIALQPPGRALPTQPDSNWVKLLAALSAELQRVDDNAQQLVEEITVGDLAIEMLGEWEDALGLPDPCAPSPTDPAIRRARIHAKLASIGGQSKRYYIDVIAKLGYSIGIETFDPFEMGVSGMGDGVGGNEWANVWQVNVPGDVPDDIRALIECVIHQLMPAHTVVMFGYNGQPPEGVVLWVGGMSWVDNIAWSGGHD